MAIGSSCGNKKIFGTKQHNSSSVSCSYGCRFILQQQEIYAINFFTQLTDRVILHIHVSTFQGTPQHSTWSHNKMVRSGEFFMVIIYRLVYEMSTLTIMIALLLAHFAPNHSTCTTWNDFKSVSTKGDHYPIHSTNLNLVHLAST